MTEQSVDRASEVSYTGQRQVYEWELNPSDGLWYEFSALGPRGMYRGTGIDAAGLLATLRAAIEG